ncbi:hypothetical protein M758_8G151000 [Ceratodon purpureus]|nr:hypothetical protein M758_8G151000 [Ceratodon purpureus]
MIGSDIIMCCSRIRVFEEHGVALLCREYLIVMSIVYFEYLGVGVENGCIVHFLPQFLDLGLFESEVSTGIFVKVGRFNTIWITVVIISLHCIPQRAKFPVPSYPVFKRFFLMLFCTACGIRILCKKLGC